MFHPRHHNIRPATDADAQMLEDLAWLDSQRPLRAPVLVGEIDGSIAAAVSVSEQRVVADPCRRTAVLVSHMRVRVAAERAVTRTPSLRERMLAGVPASMRRGASAAQAA